MKCPCEFLPAVIMVQQQQEEGEGEEDDEEERAHRRNQEGRERENNDDTNFISNRGGQQNNVHSLKCLKLRKGKNWKVSVFPLQSWNKKRGILTLDLFVTTTVACVQLFVILSVMMSVGVDAVPHAITTMAKGSSILISSGQDSNSSISSGSRSSRSTEDIIGSLKSGSSDQCVGIIRNVKDVASQSIVPGVPAGGDEQRRTAGSNEGWDFGRVAGEQGQESPSTPNTYARYQNLCGRNIDGGSDDFPHPSSSSSRNRSTSESCCKSMIIPQLLHSPESHLLLATFNNSFKYSTFKTQITAHHLKLTQSLESLVLSSSSSSSTHNNNKELWNATIDGLKVLREWGVKYWDPMYLYKNRVFSGECLRRIAQNSFCYACGGGANVHFIKPCKSLCHNTVMGCLKSPLAEYIEAPWKHAVNSVRTAVRLVMTTGGGESGGNGYMVVGGGDTNRQPLQDLVNDLNDWREPITWWLDEYKSSRACEGLPSTNCWNGESVGRYESSPVTWRSSYNPEFGGGSSMSGGGGGGSRGGGNWMIDPLVTVELDKFRNELVYVRRTLEKFWPTTSSSSHHHVRTPHALPLSSMEDNSHNHHNRGHPLSSTTSGAQQQLHSLVHFEGSGAGGDDAGFESDDEDLEYNNSGYGPPIETDDEDLAMGGGGQYYGSGSGDGGDDESPFDNNDHRVTGGEDGVGVVRNDKDGTSQKDRPPVSLSGGSSQKGWSSIAASIMTISLLLLSPALFLD